MKGSYLSSDRGSKFRTQRFDGFHLLRVQIDDEAKRVRVSLRGNEILAQLSADEDTENPANNQFLWRPGTTLQSFHFLER